MAHRQHHKEDRSFSWANLTGHSFNKESALPAIEQAIKGGKRVCARVREWLEGHASKGCQQSQQVLALIQG